jgi:hypothetical protein
MTLAALLASAASPESLTDAQLHSTLVALLDEHDRIEGKQDPTNTPALLSSVESATAMIKLREEQKRRAKGGGTRGDVGGGMAARMTSTRGLGEPSPTASPTPAASAVTITAATSTPSMVAGTPLTSSAQLGAQMAEQLRRMDLSRAPLWGGDLPRVQQDVAFARWKLPEDRQLTNDAESNTRKIEAVCGLNAKRFDPVTHALVASGGICLPVNVDYAVPTWSTADRPLRDALPAFQANRGGLRFVSPPDIGVPSLEGGTASGAGVAAGLWPEATDADPAGATKPVWVVPCGSEELTYLGAVTTRVQFGNMQSRFAPEQVAANTEQAMAVTARQAELNLLTLIANNSKQLTPRQYLGAARDFLATLDLTIEMYKQSHRIPNTASFTAILPQWFKGVIRADLLREIGHDNAGSQNVLAITDEQIEGWLKARNVTAVWTLDSLEAGTYGTGGSSIPTQYFSVATAGAQPTWPSESTGADPSGFKMAWFLYVEGTFQFLDGGELDLGIVRDSLLDSTNDFEIFTETFEGVAFRGLECYQIQQLLFPAGGSAGTVATTNYGE